MNHKTHHKGGCQQMTHTDGGVHSFGGDCTDSGRNPVNGGWSGFSGFGTCAKSCGGGTKDRSRTCTNPTPKWGGAQCPGSATNSVACNTHACPVDGTWNAWSNWGACSKSCAAGTQVSTRTCKMPEHGGKACGGAARKSQGCNHGACPVHCATSAFENWSACTKSCGTGSRSRSRTITTKASDGGYACPYLAETQSCGTSRCPVDGTWSGWSSYGACSKSCGTGTQERTRSCTGKAFGGKACVGSTSNSQDCNTASCPVDGTWSSYGGWSGCTKTCGTGTQSSTRSCDGQAHGGKGCSGSSSRSQNCNTQQCVCSNGTVKFGNKFVQIGSWRFGDVDGGHFSMAYKGGKTAQIYRSDGTLHGGPRSDYTTWGRGLDANAPGISFGDRFIQIGQWRICDIDGSHASICTVHGKTAQIFRGDGTLHAGPRNDYCCHGRPINNNHPNRPTIGDRYLQIGKWRFGDIDGEHASASSNSYGYVRAAQIWRGDGTLHGGGHRSDWHCYAWSNKQCGRNAMRADAKTCARK